jgi:hypothetical protein
VNGSSDFPPSPPTSRITWIVFGSLAVLLLAIFLYPALHREKGVRHIDRITATLHAALALYKEEFGTYPAGNSRAVSKALQGDNPKQKHFIELSRGEVSPEGDLLDPWGTPYLFYFSGQKPLIRSAGENRQFDDSTSKHCDDYFRG